MTLPKKLKDFIDQLTNLPKTGPKSATRLAFWLLAHPKQISQLTTALKEITNIKPCSICGSLLCVCQDKKRDKSQFCLVQDELDILAIEKSGQFKGIYHKLGNEQKPNLEKLKKRLKKAPKENKKIKEIILAFDPTTEGDMTSLYIKRELKKAGFSDLIFTRPARGLPTGADLDFADSKTLQSALKQRTKLQ